MIIVQLKGGLGNQLFQYAAGLSLSTHHNVPVKVDVSELKHPDEEIGTMRNYELQHLIAPPLVASQKEIDELTKNTFKKYIQKALPSYRRVIYNEKKFQFDKYFFNAGKNIYLKGYRQSEQYFLPVANKIRSAFQFKPAITANVADLAVAIKSRASVSIHVRRGDYTNKALSDFHGAASETYYQQAIDKITTVVEKPFFYVFSDDIKWAQQHLRFSKEVAFVSGNGTENHYEDFYLMSRCSHNIIANSSFSWWAAWLNANREKVVIAPQKWFNTAKLNASDLIPGKWVRL